MPPSQSERKSENIPYYKRIKCCMNCSCMHTQRRPQRPREHNGRAVITYNYRYYLRCAKIPENANVIIFITGERAVWATGPDIYRDERKRARAPEPATILATALREKKNARGKPQAHRARARSRGGGTLYFDDARPNGRVAASRNARQLSESDVHATHIRMFSGYKTCA